MAGACCLGSIVWSLEDAFFEILNRRIGFLNKSHETVTMTLGERIFGRAKSRLF